MRGRASPVTTAVRSKSQMTSTKVEFLEKISAIVIVLTVVLVGMLILFVGGIVLVLYLNNEEPTRWVECKIRQPDEDSEITLFAKDISKYRAKVTKGGETFFMWLHLSSFKKSHINVYWYPVLSDEGPYIRLKSTEDESLIDLKKFKSYLVVRLQGRAFIGEIVSGSMGYSSAVSRRRDNGWDVSVKFEGTAAIEVTGGYIGQSKGEYLGKLVVEKNKADFIPASESEEIPIRKSP